MSAPATLDRHAVVLEAFSVLRKNMLRGFGKVRLPSGMIVHDTTMHVGGNNKIWASPPSKAILDREGDALRYTGGKVRCAPAITFATKEQCDRFSAVVVNAVREAHPDALA
jgi:hypothetical protein